MAIDVKPSTWIASWSENGTDVTFPIASVPLLSAEEADATTGDMRKVIFALASKFYSTYIGTASADRPSKMSITKSASTNTETGIVTNVFTFRFYTEVTGEEVVAES